MRKGHILSIVLFIFVIGLIVRLGALETPRDFWHDEGFQYLYSQEPVSLIIDSNDVHPPLFNLFTHFLIDTLGINSIFWLRFIILVLSLALILSAYYIFSEIFNDRVGLLVMAGLALSPTFIRYSVEFRNYIFALLIVIWQMYFYHKNYEDTHNNSIGYITFSVLMVCTHYLTGLILFCQLLYSIYNKKFKDHFWNYALVGTLLIPCMMYLWNTLPKIQSFWFKDIDLVSLVSTFTYIIVPPMDKLIGWSFFIYGTAILTYLIYRKKLPQHYYLYVTYLVLPIVIMWGISQYFPFYHHRYFLFGGIGIYVLVAIGVDKLAERIVDIELGYIGVLIALLLFTNAPFFTTYDTELLDASTFLDNYTQGTEYVVVHTSVFSQTPMKVYLPEVKHYLLNNLSKAQQFTAGGTVVNQDEHIQNINKIHTNKSIYFVSDKPVGDIIYKNGGLYIGKR